METTTSAAVLPMRTEFSSIPENRWNPSMTATMATPILSGMDSLKTSVSSAAW